MHVYIRAQGCALEGFKEEHLSVLAALDSMYSRGHSTVPKTGGRSRICF